MHSMIKKSVVLVAGMLVLAGCAHINLWTALKFAGTDFLDVNPETARVAVVLSEGADIRSGQVKVKGTLGGNVVLDYAVDLEIVREGPELAALPADMPRDRARVIRIPRHDVQRVRDLQLETSRFIALEDDDKSLDLSIILGSEADDESDACAANDSSGSIAVWIRLDDDASYSRLLSERAFAKIIGQSIREQCRL